MKKNKNMTEEVFVFDAHCDTANVLFDQSSYFIKENKSHLTIEKSRKGGLKAQIFALWVNQPNIKKNLMFTCLLSWKL